MKRSALVIAALSCAGLIAVAAIAQASARIQSKNYKVTFTKTQREFVTGVGYRYTGTMKASNKDCVKKRPLQVFIGPLGEYHEVKTTKNGDWEVPDSTITPAASYEVDVFSDTHPIGKGDKPDICKKGHGTTTFPAINPP